ncbi:glycoside hydrolase family 97 catalytic domain-containing protein [Thalassotalea fusca]
MLKSGLLVSVLWCLAFITYANTSTTLSVHSPSRNINVEFTLVDGRPAYRVLSGENIILATSALGFELKSQNALRDKFTLIDQSHSIVDEQWTPVWGERSRIDNHYRELMVHLQQNDELARRLDIVFRVFDDGIAFRYQFPEQDNLKQFAITAELTSFAFTDDHTSWSIPADYDSYEHLYHKGKLSDLQAANTPITLKSKQGQYFSLHEAALTNYAGMALVKAEESRLSLTSDLVPWPDGVKVKAETPFKTPWRTLQIADSLAELVESDIIANLNEPSAIKDTSWIKPIKYIGIWWAMHMRKFTWQAGPNHGATTENTKQYIDFASQHGVDAVLVEGWNKGWETWHTGHNVQDFTQAYPDFDLNEVTLYGQSKGVMLMGHHETGGNIPLYEGQLEQAFKLYHYYGVKAIKTGYAGKMWPAGHFHHGQFMVNHYRKVVELAAKYHIMLNVHEPIKATGIRRTFPNMMTREGARGMEWNGWSEGNSPEHTTTLPFTRLLAGPLDYTPGIFNIQFDPQLQYRVHSTLARQLALYVTLYSPMQMAADMIENYQQQAAFEFIKQVPVNWDETKLLAGEIGDFAVFARRKGQQWFIGSTTDEHPRQLRLTLDFLQPNTRYIAKIYSDAKNTDFKHNPTAIAITEHEVKKGDQVIVTMASAGGNAIHIFPTVDNVKRKTIEAHNQHAADALANFIAGNKYGEIERITHLAVGKKASYGTQFDEQYTGGGQSALTDGILGSADYSSLWQGYRQRDLDVTIDLEKITRINTISVGFLQSILHSILLPTTVEFLLSNNGNEFTKVGQQEYVTMADVPDYQRKRFQVAVEQKSARFVRIKAKNISQLPAWHIRPAQEAFIFADEIVVK